MDDTVKLNRNTTPGDAFYYNVRIPPKIGALLYDRGVTEFGVSLTDEGVLLAPVQNSNDTPAEVPGWLRV